MRIILSQDRLTEEDFDLIVNTVELRWLELGSLENHGSLEESLKSRIFSFFIYINQASKARARNAREPRHARGLFKS
jgi:hypothetical protein